MENIQSSCRVPFGVTGLSAVVHNFHNTSTLVWTKVDHMLHYSVYHTDTETLRTSLVMNSEVEFVGKSSIVVLAGFTMSAIVRSSKTR